MASEEFINSLKEMGWPQEFKEKLLVSNLKSNVGIAVLWSFKEVVAKNLNPDDYAILGNYYDRRNGLEPLVRNCLANPNLRYIILLGNDKARSREVLVNFFEKGVDKDGVVVGTDTKVPRGIPTEDLEKLRQNIRLIDATDEVADQNDSEEFGRIIKELVKTLEPKEPYDEPKLYEKPPLETDSFPSEKVGFVVRGKEVGETWLKVLDTVYNYGAISQRTKDESSKFREVINLVTVVSHENPDIPKMEPYFRFDEDYLKSYYDEICTDRIPEGTLYTYGSRFRAWDAKTGEKIDQIADLIEFLKVDPYRKSAVAITWIVEDELMRRYRNKDKNSPCIDLIQPNIQEGVLHFTVYIRSNDMFRAWPLNAFGLRKLQKILAEGIGVKMGDLTTISCSAHIYQENWDDTKDILKNYYKGTHCFFDPRGYYTIKLESGKIKADHYSPDSQLLKQYEGVTAREVNDSINSSQHTTDPYHAAYIAEELMKAEAALKEGVEYIQDSPVILKSGSKFGFTYDENGNLEDTVVAGDSCETGLCDVDLPSEASCGDSCEIDSCDSCSVEPVQFVPEVNLERNETYLEKEIDKMEDIYSRHIVESNKQGKDLFEHWKKPQWDEYFMSMAILASMRSFDPSQKNGAIIVDEHNKILSIGYNGFPRGSVDQLIPSKRPDKHLYIVHAEQNAILNKQFDLTGSTLYVTAYPCLSCIRSIIQAGIKRVVYLNSIKSREITENDEFAIRTLLVGRKDLIFEKFEQDPLECLYKAVEYYKIKKKSKEKKSF